MKLHRSTYKQGGRIMTKIIDRTSDDFAKQWLCGKGYSVEIREDMVQIRQNGKNKAEIVYFPGPSVCYFLAQDEDDIRCCNLEKKSMFIDLGIATICIVKEKEGEIFFSVSI